MAGPSSAEPSKTSVLAVPSAKGPFFRPNLAPIDCGRTLYDPGGLCFYTAGPPADPSSFPHPSWAHMAGKTGRAPQSPGKILLNGRGPDSATTGLVRTQDMSGGRKHQVATEVRAGGSLGRAESLRSRRRLFPSAPGPEVLSGLEPRWPGCSRARAHKYCSASASLEPGPSPCAAACSGSEARSRNTST